MFNNPFNKYYDCLEHLLQVQPTKDRTGVGRRRMFGVSLEFDMSNDYIPICTEKFVSIKDVVEELRWFLTGSTNIADLKSSIWNEWATEDGELGKIYGYQWRNRQDGDQIQRLIDGIIHEPFSSRHFVSAYDPSVLPDSRVSPQENVFNGKQALPPCHTNFQVVVDDDVSMSTTLIFSMRSNDGFIGNNYNILSYAVLLRLICKECCTTPKKLVMNIGDFHLYDNHVDAAKTLLEIAKKNRVLDTLPKLKLHDSCTISDPNNIVIEYDLIDYNNPKRIKAPVAV